ncbi:MAG TPA: ATP-binding protein [Pirellulales bacterium]|nr:ATP-binding protein [Pirellulales bacterium]
MSAGDLHRKRQLPQGVTLDERPPFVPTMVMTPQLMSVVRDVVAQWQHRDKFAGLVQYGIRPLDRLLFYGPPGNGKTLACYWIAKQLGIPMYRVLCNQLRGSYLGETTRAVAAVMDHLNAVSDPAICLWDEIESIFVDRSVSSSSCDREIASALTLFLQGLDRWRAPVLVVMATNLVGQLDAALLSRIEMRLEFVGPDANQAEQLLNYWCELLAKFGADEWGPVLKDRIQSKPPASFRELQQTIAFAARQWVAKQCT